MRCWWRKSCRQKQDTLSCLCNGEACLPPEDCGGIWGYYDLLETVQSPDDPEHEDMLDWLGEGFDPEAFDLDAINQNCKTSSSDPPFPILVVRTLFHRSDSYFIDRLRNLGISPLICDPPR
jgi:hypothetical protein